jgi:hypothetical protein
MLGSGLVLLSCFVLLPGVLVAYPSPDDELAAELESEISAAGHDYTDVAMDYSSTDDVDNELMNILGGGGGGGGGKAASPAAGGGAPVPLPPGEMPNIPGLTKGADGQMYFHGERVKRSANFQYCSNFSLQ